VLAGGSFEVNGQVTGSGAPDSFNSDLVVSNATVTLNNGNNNYTGPTYVVGGSTLQNGVENALPTNTVLTMGALSDGAVVNTYDLNPNNQTIAALASAGGATNIVQASTQGSQTLTINGAQSTTYSGLIQSAVALIRSGTGNTTLTGSNSYSGGTTILSGSLTTANVRALGSGGVSLNGGRLIVQSLLNIASLNWNAAGVIALPNAGAKQYVNATGNLVINGSKNTFDLSGLQLTSTPVELLASANMGGFNTNEFAATGVTDYSLLISNNALWIEALGSGYVSYPNFVGYAINRNQTNVAAALNSFTNKPTADQTVVLNSLQALTNSPASMQQAFNAIMPNFYQQMATIAFNGANAQNMELNQRLWGMRVAQGGGFSMTGFADNTPFLQEGQGDGEGKGVLDAKKDILRPGLDNRWGMFLDANGIFASANSANMLPGYQSESGGVTTGLTYKWNKNVATGLYAGYQGTYNKSGANGSGLGVGSTLIDNAVRFGLFGTYGQTDVNGLPLGFYANALAGGAYNNYQAARIIQYSGVNRTANSSPGAGELDTMLAGGYDVKRGNFTFGPTASLQYTYLGANGVNETGAQSLDFNSAGWNSASMLSSVGAHAAYTWYARKLQGHEITVVPQINLNWQHEFMQNPYAINGNLGGTTPNFSNWSAAPLRDTLYTGVGFTVELANKWNTSFFYNAAAGNNNLQSQNIFWSVGAKF
jgi:autotransporter-associated beta strand protein